MREREKDAALDAVLEASLPEAPPEEIVRAVTPWRRAMDQVLTGLALNAVTLKLLGLDVLLSTVGLILLLLGLRALRRENGWFRACYILTLARSLLVLPALVLDAFLYQPPFAALLPAAVAALLLPSLLCLWQGLRAVRTRAGLPAGAAAAGALIVWYLALYALALLGWSGLAAGIVMLAAFILIVRGLYSLSRELDEAGYTVAAAPVRVSDSTVARVLAGLLAAGVACGYLFGSRCPMDWTPTAPADTQQTAELRETLLALGYPREALEDLTAEELAACAGARQVVVRVVDQPVNDGRQVVQQEGNTEYHSTVYDVKELRFTAVAVELPGERETWRVYHHFRWLVDPDFRGSDCLQLWPATQDCEGWDMVGQVTGRVLYTRDGTDYAAPYAALDQISYTTDSPIWGARAARDVFAQFSPPARGQALRGYVAYTVSAHYADVQYLINSWLNYTHQTGWLQYPVKTAAEYRMSSAWGALDPFRTVQSALQFYNTDGGIDLLESE